MEPTLRRGDHSGWCISVISSENLVENRKKILLKFLDSLSRSRTLGGKRVTGTLANTRAPPSRPRPARPGVPHPEVPGAPGALREERGNVARHDRDYPGSKTASEH